MSTTAAAYTPPMDDETEIDSDDTQIPDATTPTSDASEANAPYRQRVFRYITHTIPDPGSTLSIEDVRRALMAYFPDLVQATHTQKVEGDTLVITFAKQTTRKGADATSTPVTLLSALAQRVRRLPRFQDPLNALNLPDTLTLADLAARRTDILEILDAHQALPQALERIATQCLKIPPMPLPKIPVGF